MDPRLFDRFADRFAETRQDPWIQVDAFLDDLPPDARILDLGCANGRHMDPRSIGLDASRRLLWNNPHDGRVVLGLVESTPFPDDAFDAVLCIAVLHHFQGHDDRRAVLEETVRVARSGAPLLLSCWRHDQERFEDGPQDVDVPFTDRDGDEHMRPYHLFQPDELAEHLREVGIAGPVGWSAGLNHWVRGRVP